MIATSNGSGAGTIYSYGAYGEPANDNWSGSRFRYTGQIALPEIALYHYKARVYDPRLGRFLQTDPVGYEDDLNLYLYVANDPLNRSDPTGRVTFAVGWEQEVVTPNDPEPAHGSGGGGFLNFNLSEGTVTWGTYTTDREVGGADAGASGAFSVTGGNVGDFAGESTTVEANAKFGVGASLEGGLTSSGAPTASVEYGLGTPGLSAGVTTTTIQQSGSFNGPEIREQAVQQATEAAEQASEFVRTLPERIREGLGLPQSP